jgi:phospholipase C
LHYRAAGLLFFLLVGAGGIVACSGGSGGTPIGLLPSTGGSRGSKPVTPIKHVIVVIQENRSFDDFFADFPGANGTTVGLAERMPASIAQFCKSKKQPVITKPTSVPLTEVSLLGKGFPSDWDWDQDLSHDYVHGYLGDCDSSASQPNGSNPCKMDGFDLSYSGANGSGSKTSHPTCTYTYQYVNPKDITPYWDIAQQYVLADNAFQTQGSLSFTAHQDLIAGGTAINQYESVIDDPTYWPWGCGAPPGVKTSLIKTNGQYLGNQGPFPCFSYETIRDLLDAKAISWKFYATKVIGGNAGIWSAFQAIDAVYNSKEWGTKVTWPDTNVFKDIKAGRLPAVAWITPDALNSDHPAEVNKNKVAVDNGPAWVASIVNAIGKSKYWNSSAIVILWDDWGGFYDHVPPPFYDTQGGLGFRFPMLIVSPYVQAHVEHTQYETASVLRFIENNWNLSTLGQEDARATGIGNAFDFNQAPRPFQVIPSKYPQSFFLHQKPSGLAPDTE